jgi:hypothetical protein
MQLKERLFEPGAAKFRQFCLIGLVNLATAGFGQK